MKVNYPELGGVSGKKMYKEGDFWRHPSGTLYQRRGGRWVVVEEKKPGEGT